MDPTLIPTHRKFSRLNIVINVEGNRRFVEAVDQEKNLVIAQVSGPASTVKEQNQLLLRSLAEWLAENE